MPDSKGGLQLLPETRKKINVKVPGENRMLIIGFLVALLVGGMYVGVITYIGTLKDKIVKINDEILAVEALRDKKSEQTLIALSKQTALVVGLINNHIFMSRALDKIAGFMQDQIQIKSGQINVFDRRVILGVSAPDYITVARQIVSGLNDDGVTDVNIGALQADPDGLSFSLDIKLDLDKTFKKP